MTREPARYVADIVHAAGGRLVSRIRLQKVVYLLEQKGADTGFSFSYHHYGPYSREIDSAILEAKAFNLVSERFDYRQSDGARYSVFEEPKNRWKRFRYLDRADLQKLVAELNSESIITLELAATAHWLSEVEKVDWKKELVARKGSKTKEGRLAKALDLLKKLNLPPAETASR